MTPEKKKDKPDFDGHSDMEGCAGKPSTDDLNKIISTSLTNGFNNKRVLPTWIIRLISMLAGAAAILLLYLLIRYIMWE